MSKSSESLKLSSLSSRCCLEVVEVDSSEDTVVAYEFDTARFLFLLAMMFFNVSTQVDRFVKRILLEPTGNEIYPG
jgi:hypothetical protein